MLVSFLVILLTFSSAAQFPPLTVETTNGPITGHSSSNRSAVMEYLGIPYAQPPLGALRFAPPQKYTGKRARAAANWGLDCPLIASAPTDYPNRTPQAQRIVSTFVSGDGNPQGWTTGTTSSRFYNGEYLADAQDVVVVTVNYRVNIFGFPGAPNVKQNHGLRDQRMAIEWIRDNIARFGGNKFKIVIFGQSSGGVAVDYYSYAYIKDPIVSGLISHSGNALSFPYISPPAAAANWYNVSEELGCGSSGDTLPCMRMAKWTDIRLAASRIRPIPGSNPVRSIPPFQPSSDGELVFDDYVKRSGGGKFAKLPYLLGNTNYEQGYYAIPAYAQGVNITAAQGSQFLLESFTCPNSFEANNRIRHSVPTWQFRYFGEWENIRLYPDSGSYHGSDLHMIFGASQDVSGIPPSRPELLTTAIMQHAWAAFAEDPQNGLSRTLHWPIFNPRTNSLVRLAYDNNPNPDFVSPSVYDAPCSTIMLGGVPAPSTTTSS